jgi:hypothetical protein
MGNPAAWSEPVHHHPRRRDPAGLSLILGTTRLINFAHGELVTLGATVAFLLNALVMGMRAPTMRVALAKEDDHHHRGQRG